MNYTKSWIKKQGKLVSKKSCSSVTIQFKNRYLADRFRKRMKYQNIFSLYSTGYPNRINIERW